MVEISPRSNFQRRHGLQKVLMTLTLHNGVNTFLEKQYLFVTEATQFCITADSTLI